ncbi:MAG TPA: hypothetical protein VEQ10_12690 [Vicinamibacteria bacterium]|nr:hypothetical protein [Vicinamibacteria bacterium]
MRTSTSTIDYHGWGGSLELRNDAVRVVVVPAIGRVMHLGLTDEPNLLWENAALAGRTLPGTPLVENGRPVWANFGGDRVWPTEESWFPRLNGAPRPPDPWIDGLAFEAKPLHGGVRLEGQVSPLCGARLVRTIRLSPSGTRVSMCDRLEKVQLARRRDLEPVPLTVWGLTQIRPPEESLVSLASPSRYPARFLPFRWDDLPGNDPASHFSVSGNVGVFLTDPKLPQKVGADAPRWVAAIVDSTVLARVFRYQAGLEYPDGGTSATIFTAPDLAELETLSPLARLRPGESLEHRVDWEIRRLQPQACGTPEEKRRHAVQWLESLRPPEA